MDQIDSGHKEIGYSDEKEIAIFYKLANIPGDKKKPAADHHAEDLDQAVEQQIAVEAEEVQAQKYRGRKWKIPVHQAICSP